MNPIISHSYTLCEFDRIDSGKQKTKCVIPSASVHISVFIKVGNAWHSSLLPTPPILYGIHSILPCQAFFSIFRPLLEARIIGNIIYSITLIMPPNRRSQKLPLATSKPTKKTQKQQQKRVSSRQPVPSRRVYFQEEDTQPSENTRASISKVNKKKQPRRPQLREKKEKGQKQEEEDKVDQLTALQQIRPNDKTNPAGLKTWKEVYNSTLRDQVEAAARVRA